MPQNTRTCLAKQDQAGNQFSKGYINKIVKKNCIFKDQTQV